MSNLKITEKNSSIKFTVFFSDEMKTSPKNFFQIKVLSNKKKFESVIPIVFL